MRSSNKSRSRNKNNNNRNRNVGNVVNRVFDSAGPEGKVRGTPSQVIEKYSGLARDAQLSGDRVAAENFQQHAEHYTRMLNEAQREQAERQAADARNRPPQQQHDNSQNANQHQGNNQQAAPQPDANAAAQGQQPRPQADVAPDPGAGDQPVIAIDPQADAGPDLVETPEAAAKPAKAERKPRTRARRSAPKEDSAPVASAEAQAD